VAFEGKLDPAQFERVLLERAVEWDRARALARALDGEGRAP